MNLSQDNHLPSHGVGGSPTESAVAPQNSLRGVCVYGVFSAHGGEVDAHVASQEIERLVLGASQGQKIILVFEDTGQATTYVGDSHAQTGKLISRMLLEAFADRPEKMCGLIAGDSTMVTVASALAEKFIPESSRQARGLLSNFTGEHSMLRHHDFYRAIVESVARATSTRTDNVEIVFENPSIDCRVLTARSALAKQYGHGFLVTGDVELSRIFLQAHFEAFNQAQQTRDAQLCEMLAALNAEHCGAKMIVIRGEAHATAMQALVNERGGTLSPWKAHDPCLDLDHAHAARAYTNDGIVARYMMSSLLLPAPQNLAADPESRVAYADRNKALWQELLRLDDVVVQEWLALCKSTKFNSSEQVIGATVAFLGRHGVTVASD